MPKAGEKRTEAQKKADKKYMEKYKDKIKENFANVSATFKKAEAEAIRAIFTAHGIKTADALRAAAHYLQNGGTIQAGQEPIQTASATPDESPDATNGANG